MFKLRKKKMEKVLHVTYMYNTDVWLRMRDGDERCAVAWGHVDFT